ncbi:glutathione-disulfide reductase [Alkalibacterium sp. 20]|uniref:glutathione-disulfide reductase n=1 Tax=Alkalibacterium sp. 20 TaxID=1798803 RepID=UPI0008FFE719|nr:glutathione-disulfide reductase [Alkalibacterium sp. 20]OJF91908.1 glutathione reductase [Alkalibacterium sp. 20]
MTKHYDYDYLVIGGGSGGIASANRAAMHGARVALIEEDQLGGTCVNLGCVPKKVMWYVAEMMESIHSYATDYGIELEHEPVFNYKKMMDNREKYISFLHKAYKKGLDSNNITLIKGRATFIDDSTVEVAGQEITASHILIATGGKPKRLSIPGGDLGIVSDDVFRLEELPKSIAVIGGGYIGVEMSGIFNALGVETHLFVRKPAPLYNFDSIICEGFQAISASEGRHIHVNKKVIRVEQKDSKILCLHFEDGTTHETEQVLWATGRVPNTKGLNLEAAGVNLYPGGYVEVDRFQNTTGDNIYSVGDVTGRAELTPVAIAAGRYLSERVFNDKKDEYLDYNNIPTVIFTHPPIGTVGMTEEQVRDEYPEEAIKIYKTEFTSMHSSITDNRQKMYMKLVCVGRNEKVVGLHGIGKGMDELLQGFTVAIQMGATKKDFDRTIAIHPTAAEEFVTMK